ncbi:MAG: MFS transporter, partial [Planctomycetales bacterium]|nr:MFS transporter [Planctomycetales bacterium]
FTALTAMLAVPWALKFLWAPVVDALHDRGWSLRRMIMTAQSVMIACLVPLIGVDPVERLDLICVLLLLHAVAASTQDVAIDAWCISLAPPEEHGRINGWMQAGMLLGRSLLGGGALVMTAWIGSTSVVMVLCIALLLCLGVLWRVDEPAERGEPPGENAFARLTSGLTRFA